MRPLRACLRQAHRGARAPQARGSAKRFLERSVRAEGGLSPGEKRLPRRPCAGPDACHKPIRKGRWGRPSSTRRSLENPSTSGIQTRLPTGRPRLAPPEAWARGHPARCRGNRTGHGLARGRLRGWGDASGTGGRQAARAARMGERVFTGDQDGERAGMERERAGWACVAVASGGCQQAAIPA